MLFELERIEQTDKLRVLIICITPKLLQRNEVR